MEGVRRGPPNAVRHHGEEKEEEEVRWLQKFIVFWDVKPCSHVEVDQRFRGAYCLHHQGNSWWWRQYAPLKRSSTSTWLHGATSQNTPKLNFFYSVTSGDDCTVYKKLYYIIMSPEKLFCTFQMPSLKYCLKHRMTACMLLYVTVLHLRTWTWCILYKLRFPLQVVGNEQR
jgi:hypothetical protein